MELHKNSQRLKINSYFRIKTTLQMFDKVISTLLTKPHQDSIKQYKGNF